MRTRSSVAGASRVDAAVEVVCATSDGSQVEGAWTGHAESWDAAQPVAALVERSRGTDLIVVGSRGLHGPRALGSVSERAIETVRRTTFFVVGLAPIAFLVGLLRSRPHRRARDHDMMRPFVVMLAELMPFMDMHAGHGDRADGKDG